MISQDDWRAMREAALKEQAAGADSADTPMVDEDVKPCMGELQVPRLVLAACMHPPGEPNVSLLASFDCGP